VKILLPRHQAAIEPYRLALPPREYAALAAWLTTFYNFQLDWILDQSRFAICNKSRQIGMSHSTAAICVLWGAFHGELTTIISLGERESKEVLTYAKKHRAILAELGSRMAAIGGSDSALEIQFASGGRIIALPGSGGRSFSGNIFLDEYAYHEHPDKVWDSAIAVTLHGYRARVASTPNGVGNDFYHLWTQPQKNKGWSKHEITLQQAVADGMAVNIEACWTMAKGDPRLFDQMFNCKFLDGQLQYIPTEAIEGCSVDDPFIKVGECYAGLDIGHTVDRTELVIVRKDPRGIRWQQYSESCKRTSVSDIHRLVDTAFGARWQCRRLCIDATGIGAFPAEELQRHFGSYRVELVKFTQDSKEDLATSLHSAFVGKTVRISKSDTVLRDDLCAIRRIITSAGNVRYDAPQTDQGHADSAWALALALHGCNDKPNYRTTVSGS